MSKGRVQIDWHTDNVRLVLKDASDEAIRAAAFQILSHAQVNILQNDQILTGFMRNSGYVKTHKDSTYADTERSGIKTDRQGNKTRRERAPEADLPRSADAFVAFGASYTLTQELQKPFLFPALTMTVADMGGIISKIAKQKGLT